VFWYKSIGDGPIQLNRGRGQKEEADMPERVKKLREGGYPGEKKELAAIAHRLAEEGGGKRTRQGDKLRHHRKSSRRKKNEVGGA